MLPLPGDSIFKFKGLNFASSPRMGD